MSANDQSYTLPPATSNILGGIKVGSNLSVTQDGILSADDQSYMLPIASASTLGGIKVGERLSVTSSGVLSANDQSYTLPPATSNTLGGIKVGSNLSITQDGTLSADAGQYELPVASTNTLGGIKVGERLSVTSGGVLSANDQSYTLPPATSNTLGGIKVGNNLSVTQDGTLSADDQSYTLPIASASTLGGVKPDGSTITINSESGVISSTGEANTASNLGSGEGVFSSKSGANLQFKSLKAGSNVTISSDSSEITISSTGGGGGGMSNPMTTSGDLIVGGTYGTPTRLGVGSAGKFLKVGSSGNALEWGDGSSYTLPPATSNTLGGIKVGNNLSVTQDGTLSADAGQYELPVASTNTLGGIKIGERLSVTSSGVLSANDQSYTLPPATSNTLGGIKVGNNLSVTQDGTLSADAGQYELPVASTNTLGGIKIGERLSITSGGVLSANDQSYTLQPATSNTLGGIKVGNNLSVTQDGTLSADDQSYTLPIASDSTLGGVKPDGSTITINSENGVISSTGEANTASNLGSGEGVFSSKSGANLQFKSLKAGSNVTISSDSSEITISSAGGGGGGMSNPMTTSGDLIVGGTSGTPTRLGVGSAGKYLKVGSSGNSIEWGDGSSYTLQPATSNTLGGIKVGNNLSVTQDGTLSADDQSYTLPIASASTLGGVKPDGSTITINSESGVISSTGEANTASNLGSGEGVFLSKSGADLRFKSLKAGNNVTISSNSSEITIAASGGSGGMSNPMTTSGDLIVGGTSGTPTRLGIGSAGKFLKVGSSGNALEWGDGSSYTLPPATSNTLGGIKVGNNLSITQDGTLSADAGQYELPVANSNTLGGIKVGERLSVTSNGVLSASDQSYTLPPATSNTLGGIKVGNNLSVTQDGTLSADDQSYTLPVASASTLGGVKPDGSTITINSESGIISSTGEANTASNLGSGEGVFSSKSGVNLQFKSLKAGSNVTISADSSEITISSAGGGSGGMSNPMTTSGDLIVGGTSGTPTRLGVGSAEQALVVNTNCDGVTWKDVLSCTSKSLSSNGYFTFSDDLILQWGYLAFAGTNRKESTITLPVSFSSKNYSFSGLIKSNVSGTDKHSLCLSENARSSSTLTVCIYGADSSTTFNGITWIAVGY